MKDGTKVLEINVTPADAKYGVPNDPHNCSIARAAMRQLGTDMVVVMKNTIHVKYHDGTIERYIPDAQGRQLIWGLDKNDQRKVGTVRLLPPSPSNRLIIKTQKDRVKVPRVTKAKTTGTRRPYSQRGTAG